MYEMVKLCPSCTRHFLFWFQGSVTILQLICCEDLQRKVVFWLSLELALRRSLSSDTWNQSVIALPACFDSFQCPSQDSRDIGRQHDLKLSSFNDRIKVSQNLKTHLLNLIS